MPPPPRLSPGRRSRRPSTRAARDRGGDRRPCAIDRSARWPADRRRPAAGRWRRGAGGGRLEPLGEQIGGDVGDHVAEPRVEAERIGVEAVLEQPNAGRAGGDLAELAHQRAGDAGRRAGPRRERSDAGHRRRAGARSRRRRPRTPTAPARSPRDRDRCTRGTARPRCRGSGTAARGRGGGRPRRTRRTGCPPPRRRPPGPVGPPGSCRP